MSNSIMNAPLSRSIPVTIATSSRSNNNRTGDDELPTSPVPLSANSSSSASSSFSDLREALTRELTRLQAFIGESSQLGFPYDEEVEAFTNLFQRCVKDTLGSIQADQIGYEMQAKALLATVVVQVKELTKSSEFLVQAQHLADSYLRAEREARSRIGQLEKLAVAAEEKLGSTTTKPSPVSIVQQEVQKLVWSSNFVVVLSDIYEAIRSAKGAKVAKQWIAPATFERQTIKYWIERGRMTDLLLGVVGEAPLLVYGKSGRLTKDEHLKHPEGDRLWSDLASPISSVYFDSPKLGLYKERIARHEGAQLFRIRWYGEKPEGNGLVFLELKTHHEKWINVSSVKERVNIREKDVKSFLSRTNWGIRDAEHIVRDANPKLNGKDLVKAVELLLKMHNLVVKHDLRPCVRSVYQRVAFQSAESNELRLTVDRNITMIDETSAPFGTWSLPNEAIQDSMIKRVPFDVFEVKLAGSDMPSSIESLLRQGVIIEAAKFSKFLSGAAAFNSTKVSCLPYWAENEAFGPLFFGAGNVSKTSPTKAESSQVALRLPSVKRSGSAETSTTSEDTVKKSGAQGASVGSYEERANGAPKQSWFGALRRRKAKAPIAPKRPARVEPKSYFANERTFIQWISAALLLVAISVILLEFDALRPEYRLLPYGLALLGCSAVVLFHSAFTYLRRVRLLSRGEPYGYIDHFGPLFLSGAVFVGIFVILFMFSSTKTEQILMDRKSVHEIQAVKDVCVQHEAGLSRLEYQPSDILVESTTRRLLVPSLDTIRAHNPSTETFETLVTIPGADLEGLTSANGLIYALAEEVTKETSEIIELAREGSGLTVIRRWEIATPKAEGIAFVPPNKFYVAGDLGGDNPSDRGVIHIYELPDYEDTAGPLTGTPLNSKMINEGLSDSKISSLQYTDGILYVMHDNSKVVRSWDLAKGDMLAEWKLPPMNLQWEGLFLERTDDSGSGGRLRGTSTTDDQLLLHMVMDSPPEVWTLKVQQKGRGEIVLPDCAAL